jgi:hypothetical protein
MRGGLPIQPVKHVVVPPKDDMLDHTAIHALVPFMIRMATESVVLLSYA